MLDTSKIDSGEYYQINGTKKVLYWSGTLWFKPAKDNRGRYSGYIQPLDKQPTVNSVIPVDLYKL
jgi:hypothetical protein